MKIISLTGVSSSGKDSILQAVLRVNSNLSSIISTTSRPMREGETNGVQYDFVTPTDFELMDKNNMFIEHRDYKVQNGDIWRYGIAKDSVKKDNKDKIVIIDFTGLKQLEKYCKEHNIELISFYIDTSMWNCSIRALQREPNLDDKDIMELHRRLLDDYYNVLPAKDYCNYIVKNNTQQDFIETVLKISEVIE